jgi:hypothetical protein
LEQSLGSIALGDFGKRAELLAQHGRVSLIPTIAGSSPTLWVTALRPSSRQPGYVVCRAAPEAVGERGDVYALEEGDPERTREATHRFPAALLEPYVEPLIGQPSDHKLSPPRSASLPSTPARHSKPGGLAKRAEELVAHGGVTLIPSIAGSIPMPWVNALWPSKGQPGYVVCEAAPEAVGERGKVYALEEGDPERSSGATHRFPAALLEPYPGLWRPEVLPDELEQVLAAKREHDWLATAHVPVRESKYERRINPVAGPGAQEIEPTFVHRQRVYWKVADPRVVELIGQRLQDVNDRVVPDGIELRVQKHLPRGFACRPGFVLCGFAAKEVPPVFELLYWVKKAGDGRYAVHIPAAHLSAQR